MKSSPFTAAASGAFVDTFELPPTGSGPLDGLCFAVKDLIDVAGRRTGCGNPTWRDTHPPAVAHAVCVEQILRSGARCVGKTVTDELAFSLLGQNHHYGTPLNPRAPDRVPGGSSSGSASAVACGLVDFALGTDTGGSVRVPASNCGILGFRPSHGAVSLAGVNPLAPSFDTVGLLAADAEVLGRVASCLLCLEPQPQPHLHPQPQPHPQPTTLYLIREAFDLGEDEVRQALIDPLRRLRQRYGERVREVSLAELAGGVWGAAVAAAGGEGVFQSWRDTYCVLQWAEIHSCLGSWIAQARPCFGPSIAASFALTAQLDRRRIAEAVAQRERLRRHLNAWLGPRDLLCLPTTPALAPPRGEADPARAPRTAGGGESGYYPRLLAFTSLAGLGRLPQLSLPMGDSGGVPVGLSLLAAHGRDGLLLAVARDLA